VGSLILSVAGLAQAEATKKAAPKAAAKQTMAKKAAPNLDFFLIRDNVSGHDS
jgi:hypothetical protein